MSKSKPSGQKTTIELTARGMFQIGYDSGWRHGSEKGSPSRSDCAPSGKARTVRHFAQIRFRTMHGDYRSSFSMVNLLPKNREKDQKSTRRPRIRVAEKMRKLSSSILEALA